MRALPHLRAALLAGLFALPAATVATVATAETGTKPDVLSIGGSITEIVVALGQEHRLLARDTTSTYPASVAQLPDVGYMRALSPEGVLSVGPSLIISEAGAGPAEALSVIRAADVEFVEVPEIYSAAGIQTKITTVGAALDVPDQAAELSGQVGAALADAIKQANAHPAQALPPMPSSAWRAVSTRSRISAVTNKSATNLWACPRPT